MRLADTFPLPRTGHATLFRADPPAVAQGETAKGDADQWRIVDGKLYLNYNGAIQKKWEADIGGVITAADANWPTVLE